MTRVLLTLLCLCLTTLPVLAQGDLPYRSEMPQEGETLEVVEVPEGFGDGVISTRDAYALAEYCVWGWQQAFNIAELDVSLGLDAENRMLMFWDYVWDELDPETKTVISLADVIWPAVREGFIAGDAPTQVALLEEFFAIQDEVWGDIIEETALYLNGEMTAEDYALVLDELMAFYAAQESETGSTGGFGSSTFDGMVNHNVNYDSDYVMNDGSGDISYAE